jgi:hypothetical protein
MLQPKNLLTKRGTLLSKDPRESRKVFATIGFPDFAFGIFFLKAAPLPFRIPKRFFYARCVRCCRLVLPSSGQRHEPSGVPR